MTAERDGRLRHEREEPSWSACRELFPVTRSWTFFNHAAIAAPSSRVREAMLAVVGEQVAEGSQAYRAWTGQVAAGRRRLAELVGGTPGDIAFVPNTSTGLSLVAEGFPWQAGDAVLVPTPDFPANVYPWQHLQRRGVEMVPVPRRDGVLEVDDFARRLTSRTRMLVVSSVDYTTGFRVDLDALGGLCREHDLFFGVDAIQSLGVRSLRVEDLNIDFLAAGAHKWLLGPMGIGLLYVSPRLRERLNPPLVGWKSVAREEDFRLHFDLREDAGVFEPGTLNLAGIVGLEAAVALLQKIGLERIETRVAWLVDQLAEGLLARDLQLLTPLTKEQRCGILSFVPRGDVRRLFGHLQEAGIALALRGPGLRLSPHFYNDEEDVAHLFAVLDDLRF